MVELVSVPSVISIELFNLILGIIIYIELLLLNSSSWTYLTVWKQMISLKYLVNWITYVK